MNDEHRMQQLIAYTREMNEEPYAASIFNEGGEMLAQAIGNKQSPINHVEILAINLCAVQHPDIDWQTLTLYTTGEPCCMCAAACCWANLKAVVYATDISFMTKLWGIEGSLRAREVINAHPKQPLLIESVCREAGDALFKKFEQAFAQTWEEKRWKLT